MSAKNIIFIQLRMGVSGFCSMLSACIVWSLFSFSNGFGNKYDETNDETVVPIVLSIGGIIMLFCVIGCCNQGKECCNQEKDKTPPETEGNSLGRNYVRTDNKTKKIESQRVRCTCRQSALPVQVTFLNETPPRYSSYKSEAAETQNFNGNGGRNGFNHKKTTANHCR